MYIPFSRNLILMLEVFELYQTVYSQYCTVVLKGSVI